MNVLIIRKVGGYKGGCNPTLIYRGHREIGRYIGASCEFEKFLVQKN